MLDFWCAMPYETPAVSGRNQESASIVRQMPEAKVLLDVHLERTATR